MTFRLDEPWWLLGVLSLVPLAFFAWRWMGAMSDLRRTLALIIRGLLLALILAALAGASSVRSSDRLAVIAVIDTSESVRAYGSMNAGGRPISALQATRTFLERAAEGRSARDLLGLVVVGGNALAVSAPSADPAILARPLDLTTTEGTDLAAGLRLAQGLFPPDASRRILLISDGNQTRGDVLAAARQLAGSGRERTPIDVLPIRYQVEREVIVESVDVPGRAQAGATVTVRVTLNSTDAATGTLRLRREGEEVPIGPNGTPGRPITLNPGRNTELITLQLNPGRVHRFEAIFEPDQSRTDQLLSNNRAEGVTITPGTGSILIIDGVTNRNGNDDGTLLARTLSSEGLKVTVVPPEGFNRDLLSLQAYDLIILQNAGASVIDARAQQSLVRYVTEMGGGLVMIGGPDSLGAGGYMGGPLEPILPVRLELPDRLVLPSAAVVLVIDDSGSMNRSVQGSSRSQQAVANDGAALAIRSLDKSDLLGVITFNSEHDVLIPLGPNIRPDANAKAVLGISPGGGTNLPPALNEAITQLRAANAKVKHVIVLSDGQSEGKADLPDIARQAASEGFKISTIAVGDQADTVTLEQIANISGGEFYRVNDPNTLPRIFLRAVRVIRSPMIREEPFTPVPTDLGSPLIDGLESDGPIPPLAGLVLTQPRAERTVLYPLLAPTGEPVLAHWQAGLGQVAVFTSDAQRWANEWITWPGYRRMWLQIARSIARAASSRNAELTTEIDGDTLRLRLDATDDQRQPADGLSITGNIFSPDDQRTEVRLIQTGPGSYEASIPANLAGNYVVALSPRKGANAMAPVVGGIAKPTGQELRYTRSDDNLLAQIAAATNGRVLDWSAPQQAALFDRTDLIPRESRSALFASLIVAALVLLLLDVANRKIAWDRLIDRAELAQARGALRGRGDQAVATLSSLRRTEAAVDANRAQSSTVDRSLDAGDAGELAERERARRQAAAKVWSGPAAEPAAPQVPDPAQSAEAEQGAAGLLAAKRRARQRFGDDQP